jgi:hypothetical protein
VVEISHTGKRKDIENLAKDYILNARGSINVVIVFDIEYEQSRKATFSMWRPQLDSRHSPLKYVQVVRDEVFRDDEGNPTNNHMRLLLSDFGLPSLNRGMLREEDKDIIIAAARLCSYLDEAEKEHTGEEVEWLPPGTIIRSRPRSPSADLTSEDEAKSARLEKG